MKLAQGMTEDGIVIGNTFDKYGSRNPIVRRMMHGFESALFDLVKQVSPQTVHEVGCGEGYWTVRLHQQGLQVRGSDFSQAVIELAQANAQHAGVPPDVFNVQSIYALDPAVDGAELVICCEVLEHLEDPIQALAILVQLANPHLILSVPREPIWSLLNMARGKYWRHGGNTPGHLNRWSRRAFVELVAAYADVQVVHSPLPWTMLWATRR